VPIKNYSKGMSTRLSLSLVTSRAAELLIMDEVFDGADQFFLEKFAPRLERTVFESKSSLFISHNADILKKYCNRAVVIHNGKLVFDGAVTKGLFFYQNIS
jgi:ABC-type polysaccharide/polyol phosphate transport system ATPase subunit